VAQAELGTIPTAPDPWSILNQTPSIVTDRINVGDTGDFRTDDVFMTDVRLEKEFAATSGTSFTFSIDSFNIFNENSDLQHERRLKGTRPNYLDETV
jgi:hypothetical protein